MTISDLISRTLDTIRRSFYADRIREFKRDEHALTRAIARYGYECANRAWHLDATAIASDLQGLLLRIREQKAEIQYLPIYLESAVDRHIRQRAEELSQESRQPATIVRRVTGSLTRVEAIRQPLDVEILATLYRDLRRRRRKTKSQSPTQESLL